MKKLFLSLGIATTFILFSFTYNDNWKVAKIENIEVKGLYDLREKFSVTGRVILETKNIDGENIRLYIDLDSIYFSGYQDIDTGESIIINEINEFKM